MDRLHGIAGDAARSSWVFMAMSAGGLFGWLTSENLFWVAGILVGLIGLLANARNALRFSEEQGRINRIMARARAAAQLAREGIQVPPDLQVQEPEK